MEHSLSQPVSLGPIGPHFDQRPGSKKEVTMGTEQKVAVITGASQGIGAALVKAYRDRNYRVVATARTMRSSTDDDVLTVSGDIADRKTAERAISEGMAQFGRIDTLVNNAGIFIAKPFTQYTETDFAAIVGVNVAGFFHMTQLADRRDGEAGQRPCRADQHKPGRPRVACVTVRARVADEGRPECRDQIARDRVCEARYPGERGRAGVIKTPMHPAETYAPLGALHPLGRMGEISDVVDAILYLESAGFVTGEILHVDGGQSAGH